MLKLELNSHPLQSCEILYCNLRTYIKILSSKTFIGATPLRGYVPLLENPGSAPVGVFTYRKYAETSSCSYFFMTLQFTKCTKFIILNLANMRDNYM